MAITETGTRGRTTSGANTGSTSITVPADCEILIVGVCGDSSNLNYFSSGSMTIAGAAMTAVSGGDGGSGQKGAMFYKKSPSTGSQTLAWDWTTTDIADGGVLIAYSFWKGIDTTNTPRHATGAQQATNTHSSGTLTASSGDTIVAFAFAYSDDVERTFTAVSSNTTELAEIAQFNFSDACWYTAAPTGNMAVTVDCSFNETGGVMGIVLIPAGGGGETITMDKWSNHSAELIAKRQWGVVASGTIGIKN